LEPLVILSVDNFQLHCSFSVLDNALLRDFQGILPKPSIASNPTDLGSHPAFIVLHHQLVHHRHRNDQNPDKTFDLHFYFLLVHKLFADEEHWQTNILIFTMG
jgi:hypothetical protein